MHINTLSAVRGKPLIFAQFPFCWDDEVRPVRRTESLAVPLAYAEGLDTKTPN